MRITDICSYFEKLKMKKITQREVAIILDLSERQIKRKYKRYLEHGIKGLIHKSLGKKSSRSLSFELQQKILEALKTKLKGFGPTFSAEKLNELYQIKISNERLRKLMIEHDLWTAKKVKTKHHVWRERKHHLGELIQVDGSKHIWFGDTYYTLLLFIDDATSRIMYAKFVNEETIKSLSEATITYLKEYGRPLAIYVDRGKVYKVNNGPAGAITQYHRMLNELDIKLIFAYSPQAKGRVERSFKTHQDRLVKELQLRSIETVEEANVFLQKTYISLHNDSFSESPKKTEDFHRPIGKASLNYIFCIKKSRIIKNDYTVTFDNRWFQLSRGQLLRIGQSVTILSHFDGTTSIMHKDRLLEFTEIDKASRIKKEKKRTIKEVKFFKPSPSHPWRTYKEGDISKLRRR